MKITKLEKVNAGEVLINAAIDAGGDGWEGGEPQSIDDTPNPPRKEPSGRAGPIPRTPSVFKRPGGPGSANESDVPRLPGGDSGSGTSLEKPKSPIGRAAVGTGIRDFGKQARVDDVARRVLQCHSADEIAAELGVSDKVVRGIIASEDFRVTYLQVREEFYDKLDEIIRNEKLKPMFRAQAQAIRAQSAITDTMELIHDKVKERTAKATEMRVLMDMAFGIIDRSNNEIALKNRPERGAVNTQINILQLPSQHINLMRDTFEESEININDVLPSEEVIDVTPVSPTPEDSSDA